MRKILGAIGLLVLLAVVAAAAMLAWAHYEIRAERPALPNERVVTSALLATDPPVSLRWINTASQRMSRANVLDEHGDPNPDAAYVMSHPAFVLEWADGRILLVDVGMTRAGAESFGGPLEALAGADPIEPATPVAEVLGEAAKRVRGVLFTHLHIDHVGALPTLCDAGAEGVSVFMTEAQAERPNYTTKEGLEIVRGTPCSEVQVLAPAPAARVPGFPGVAVVAAGGHTPGSQIITVRLRTNDGDRLFALTGDIVNHVAGVHDDVSKPWAYRTFLVPEDEERQRELRAFLRDLEGGPGEYTLLVSHDQLQLESSGVAPYRAD